MRSEQSAEAVFETRTADVKLPIESQIPNAIKARWHENIYESNVKEIIPESRGMA